MFYQTQIAKLCAGGAIDTQGKRLRFIGNLPVGEGDRVWTDGTVIFGHVPPRNTPSTTPFTPPQIPALGYGNCTGFVSLGGNLTHARLMDEGWITNNEKFFEHGEETFNDKRVIDALVTDDNDLYVATEGIYKKNQQVTYNHLMYTNTLVYPAEYTEEVDMDSGLFPYHTPSDIHFCPGDLLSLGNTYSNKNDDIVIYKNGTEIVRHNLKSYADAAVDLALPVKNQIMQQSSKEGLSLFRTDSPPDDFIASAYAWIVAFNIKTNGDWDALINASAYGYCFPYVSFNGSAFAASFPNDEDKVFSNYLEHFMRIFENYVFNQQVIPLQIEQYPAFTGIKIDENGNFTAEYQQYVLDKCAYYIPLVRFRHNIWFPALFCASLLFKVHNGVIVDTLIEYKEGALYTEFLPFIDWNEKAFTVSTNPLDNKNHAGKVSIININLTRMTRKPITFPIGDNYYFKVGNEQFEAIYDNDNNEILDLSDLDRRIINDFFTETYHICYYGESSLSRYTRFSIDNTASTWASQRNVSVNKILNKEKVIVDRLYSYITNYYHPFGHNSISLDDQISSEFFKHNGWIQSISNSNEDIRLIKLCLSVLTRDRFLLGVKDFGLYLINPNGETKKLGNGLKNFRLSKLKHKSKALKH